MEEWSVNDYRKFDKLLEETKEWLLQLDSKKRLNVVREILKNPHYDESDVNILCLNEYQTPSDHHSPPEPRNPFKIQFRMKEQKPIEPVTEDKDMVKKSEKRTSRERPRDKDWSGDEEETGREKKKRVDSKKKKKKVNPVVLPEKQRDLPAELKDRIRALNGSDVIMVMEKKLYETDVNTGNGRLSLPARQIDMRFLREEEKVFLATKQNGSKVSRIRSRIIGEGGMEHGICLCKWNMPKILSKNVSVIYNLLSGWNDVLKAHELRNDQLCRHTIVQLWSFRVEGNLWFAIVKVSKSPDCNCKRKAYGVTLVS